MTADPNGLIACWMLSIMSAGYAMTVVQRSCASMTASGSLLAFDNARRMKPLADGLHPAVP